MKRKTCTAIVCAYNEEKTLAGVLHALIDSRQVDEIVVVNDGSSDETVSIVHGFGSRDDVCPISLPENRGKGYAMAEGILNARGELLLFVDADLLNLDRHFIAQTLAPMLSGEADMVIGFPIREQRRSKAINPFRPLSGERAMFREDILPLVDLIRESRFGVETLINLHYGKEEKRVCYVPLRGLIHPIKLEKSGPTEALWLYAREASQIARAVAHHHPLVVAALGLDSNGIRERCNKVGQQLSVERIVPSLRRMPINTERALSRSRETWWRRVGRQRLED